MRQRAITVSLALMVSFTLVGALAAETLNDALPSIPVPTFDISTIPGFAADARLGIISPAFAPTSAHLIIQGNLGQR